MFYSLIIWYILWVHPFYISLAEIKVNPSKNRIEISIRIFTDDLEKTLKSSNLGVHDLTHPKDRSQTDRAISQYINQHFLLETAGHIQTLHRLGFEVEGDACWNYFEIPLEKGKLGKIHIHDDILFQNHPEEINIIHFIWGNKNFSTKLENPKADYYPGE